MKKTYLVLAVLILILAAFLWWSGSVEKDTSTEPIKIGWIGPQTGPSAVLGMDSFVAAQIAVDELNANGGVNNRQVQLFIQDDQYDTEKSVNAYNKLVNSDGVKLIILNTYGSVFALADQAEKDGVLLIDPLDCNNELAEVSENVFCLATDSESVATVLAKAADANGYEKVGILYFNNDLFMPLVQKVFVDTYKGEIVFNEAYVAGTRDFRTQMSKMMSTGVDAMVLLGYDETGNAMKQARDLGFKGQFLTTGTVTSPPLQQAAEGNAEGTLLAFWGVDKKNELTKNFDTEFMARQNRGPILDLATYPTYDTVKVLAWAIEMAQTDATEEVKEKLPNIRNKQGVTGAISFSGNGAMRIPEHLFVLKDGMAVPQ